MAASFASGVWSCLQHSCPNPNHLSEWWKHSSGQIAQLVERSPEKAGVGGSIPSLATINSFHEVEVLAPARSWAKRSSARSHLLRSRALLTMFTSDHFFRSDIQELA